MFTFGREEFEKMTNFKCFYCDYNCNTPQILLKHLQCFHLYKNNIEIFCSLCDIKFHSIIGFKVHIFRHHNEVKQDEAIEIQRNKEYTCSTFSIKCFTYRGVRFEIGDSVAVHAEKNHTHILEITDIFISASYDSCILKGIQRDFTYDISNGYYSSEDSVPRSSKVRLKSLIHHKPVKVFHFNNISLFSPKSSFSVKY